MPTTPEGPDLTPDQEAEVRRLLADARHAEPMPEAVVARLDRVLADLVDEPGRDAAVVRLADRRRRAATLLVAAAAVMAVGIGVAQVLPQEGSDNASPTSAAESEVEAGAEADADMGAGGSATEGQSDEGGARGTTSSDLSGLAPVTVRDREFARDAARIQRAYAADPLSEPQALDRSRGELSKRGARLDAVCERGNWGDGRYVPVVYQRAPGWLVLRFAQGETQVADLFLCGGEVAVRSVTLPFP